MRTSVAGGSLARRSPRIAALQLKGGSELLGEGDTGCVIHPALPCGAVDVTGQVTKVYKFDGPYDEHAAASLRAETSSHVAAALAAADPTMDFFVYPTQRVCAALPMSSLDDDTQRQLRSCRSRRAAEHTDVTNTAELSVAYMPKLSRLTTPICAAASRHIQAGVRLLHKHGLTHNDLHPFNIMIGSDGLPRIIDWGLAKMSTDTRIDTRMLYNLLVQLAKSPRKKRDGSKLRSPSARNQSRSRSPPRKDGLKISFDE
jgi:hypothetical protein